MSCFECLTEKNDLYPLITGKFYRYQFHIYLLIWLLSLNDYIWMYSFDIFPGKEISICGRIARCSIVGILKREKVFISGMFYEGNGMYVADERGERAV